MLLVFRGIIIPRLYDSYVFILLTSAQNSQGPTTANSERPFCPWSGSVDQVPDTRLIVGQIPFHSLLSFGLISPLEAQFQLKVNE